MPFQATYHRREVLLGATVLRAFGTPHLRATWLQVANMDRICRNNRTYMFFPCPQNPQVDSRIFLRSNDIRSASDAVHRYRLDDGSYPNDTPINSQ